MKHEAFKSHLKQQERQKQNKKKKQYIISAHFQMFEKQNSLNKGLFFLCNMLPKGRRVTCLPE